MVTTSNIRSLPGLEDVRAAAARIQFYIHRTPLLQSRSISERVGVEVRLKCENLQRAGSFKIRGAMNALLQLSSDERRNGVVAFSSGNHAQGVALAARLLGMKATIVMPEGSVVAKVEATRAYGAEVVTAGVTSATRDTIAREIAAKSGAAVIPPFDDERIIAGAGTTVKTVAPWVRPVLAALCLAPGAGLAAPGDPFGSDDVGCVPDTRDYLHCASALARSVSTLVARMTGCERQQVDNAFRILHPPFGSPPPPRFDKEGCVRGQAKAPFDVALGWGTRWSPASPCPARWTQ